MSESTSTWHLPRWLQIMALACACAVCAPLLPTTASAEPVTILEVRYTPVARAQVAIWIEDAAGRFMATVALTEAVAFRGIGNRPGASEMNSGYRWPYGRREGVLPVWGRRRASAPGAKSFPRVIFQERGEGFATKNRDEHSADDYFCLGLEVSKSTRAALDAVSCASVFNSDKGRYMTEADLAQDYAEPYEVPSREPGVEPEGGRRLLSLGSWYPARMDLEYCNQPDVCFDHEDVKRFASDVRAIMPEIDAVARATAPAGAPQAVLFRVPSAWPAGNYQVWIEVNVEGDYLEGARDWSPEVYPTPTRPSADWDPYTLAYGYPYRGQPSIAYRVPITLDPAAPGTFYTQEAAGRASWELDSASFGELHPFDSDAQVGVRLAHDGGSGVDRLQRDAQGRRVVVSTRSAAQSESSAPSDSTATSSLANAAMGQGVVLEASGGGLRGPIGAIRELELSVHEDALRAHESLHLSFLATRSERPLHAYEVRVSKQPIVDEASFIREGRPAKGLAESAEGATALTLPTHSPEGTRIEGTVSDLAADTLYYVAVRGVDDVDRHGPISVARMRTDVRHFTTVTPCFVATAAYGTPLEHDVQALRRLRDRWLLPNALGRLAVRVYNTLGPTAARYIAPRPHLRSVVRAVLAPVVQLARRLP